LYFRIKVPLPECSQALYENPIPDLIRFGKGGPFMKKTTLLETNVVVVGSGPGGATTARELARRGKKVIICEAGGYHRRFG
jgi:NADPH-dependent 2,4-dienoyl-CoA reductase/sulfur reductase-like enzyme